VKLFRKGYLFITGGMVTTSVFTYEQSPLLIRIFSETITIFGKKIPKSAVKLGVDFHRWQLLSFSKVKTNPRWSEL